MSRTIGRAGSSKKGYGVLIMMLQDGDMLVRYSSPSTWFQTVLKTDDEKDEILTRLTDKQVDKYYEATPIKIPYGTELEEEILFLKDSGFI